MKTSEFTTLSERYQSCGAKTHQFAKDSLLKIEQQGLLPTPLHYLVMFEWLCQIDPVIAEQIDTTIKLKQYNDVTSEEIFHQLFGHLIQNKLPTAEFADMIKLLISNMHTWLSQSSQNNQEIESELNAITETLSKEGLVNHALEQLNNKIMPKLKAQHQQTLELTKSMTESQTEIVNLKAELEKATSISLTDELTNIPNRRGFKKIITDVIEQAQTAQSSFILIVIDVDFFKKINDTHGHLLGDSILRYLARFLTQETKGKDFIARVGGEEFVVVLTDTSYDNGIKFANQLRLKLANKPLQIRTQKQALNITISAGVAMYQMGEEYDSLFNRADKALYLAKNKGRNKVCGETEL